jgi:hypothetical protein
MTPEKGECDDVPKPERNIKESKDINKSYLDISNGIPDQGISMNDAGNMQCTEGWAPKKEHASR